MKSDPDIESVFRRGAIRSRTVGRLSGASLRQLQYWHRTKLISATVVPGSRGTPRMYSWIEYMKARAAVKLLKSGVPNRRLRGYIEWLEANIPDWYKASLVEFGRRVFVQEDGYAHEAASGRQTVLGPLALEVVQELQAEGPLGRLQSFSDWVSMDPRVHGGSPTVRGTRIETHFVAELAVRGSSPEFIAKHHRLSPELVRRVLAFEGEVAVAA